jgi:hypothetical protein
MTNPNLPDLLYLVQAIGWELDEAASVQVPHYRSPDQDNGAPQQAFHDRDQAEAYCAELEREKRAETNPFQYGASLEQLTPLDAERFHDWVLDAGLEPPAVDESELRSWQVWWAEQEPDMTELQRAKMWEALSWLRFYSVVELKASSG